MHSVVRAGRTLSGAMTRRPSTAPSTARTSSDRVSPAEFARQLADTQPDSASENDARSRSRLPRSRTRRIALPTLPYSPQTSEIIRTKPRVRGPLQERFRSFEFKNEPIKRTSGQGRPDIICFRHLPRGTEQEAILKLIKDAAETREKPVALVSVAEARSTEEGIVHVQFNSALAAMEMHVLAQAGGLRLEDGASVHTTLQNNWDVPNLPARAGPGDFATGDWEEDEDEMFPLPSDSPPPASPKALREESASSGAFWEVDLTHDWEALVEKSADGSEGSHQQRLEEDRLPARQPGLAPAGDARTNLKVPPPRLIWRSWATPKKQA